MDMYDFSHPRSISPICRIENCIPRCTSNFFSKPFLEFEALSTIAFVKNRIRQADQPS